MVFSLSASVGFVEWQAELFGGLKNRAKRFHCRIDAGAQLFAGIEENGFRYQRWQLNGQLVFNGMDDFSGHQGNLCFVQAFGTFFGAEASAETTSVEQGGRLLVCWLASAGRDLRDRFSPYGLGGNKAAPATHQQIRTVDNVGNISQFNLSPPGL